MLRLKKKRLKMLRLKKQRMNSLTARKAEKANDAGGTGISRKETVN